MKRNIFSVLFDSMLYLSVLICYFFSVYQKVLVLENLIQSIAFEMLGKFWQGLVYYKCVCCVLCLSLSFSWLLHSVPIPCLCRRL